MTVPEPAHSPPVADRADPGDTAVVVVVPTRNSGRTLARCLESLRNQTFPCTVVVVDNFSEDDSEVIARRLAHHVVVAGPERSRQRNIGAQVITSTIVGFVDSDMVVDTHVVEQVVERIVHGKAGAVIVPERTVGRGDWARVRAFERSFYVGHEGVEAARFFSSELFEALGGF